MLSMDDIIYALHLANQKKTDPEKFAALNVEINKVLKTAKGEMKCGTLQKHSYDLITKLAPRIIHTSMEVLSCAICKIIASLERYYEETSVAKQKYCPDKRILSLLSFFSDDQVGSVASIKVLFGEKVRDLGKIIAPIRKSIRLLDTNLAAKMVVLIMHAFVLESFDQMMFFSDEEMKELLKKLFLLFIPGVHYYEEEESKNLQREITRLNGVYRTFLINKSAYFADQFLN